jgi:hypothetical protein
MRMSTKNHFYRKNLFRRLFSTTIHFFFLSRDAIYNTGNHIIFLTMIIDGYLGKSVHIHGYTISILYGCDMEKTDLGE